MEPRQQKGFRMNTENQQPEQTQAANNCTRPPHFPPACGCPAG